MKENSNYINILGEQALRRCFVKYGIEGTEQKIKQLCKRMPGLYEFHMRIFNRLVKGK